MGGGAGGFLVVPLIYNTSMTGRKCSSNLYVQEQICCFLCCTKGYIHPLGCCIGKAKVASL